MAKAIELTLILWSSVPREPKLTVVCGPPHGLRTIPAGEGVCGEARVNESEVRAVQNMVQVVVVVVHLRRRELALVDDILGGE